MLLCDFIGRSKLLELAQGFWVCDTRPLLLVWAGWGLGMRLTLEVACLASSWEWGYFLTTSLSFTHHTYLAHFQFTEAKQATFKGQYSMVVLNQTLFSLGSSFHCSVMTIVYSVLLVWESEAGCEHFPDSCTMLGWQHLDYKLCGHQRWEQLHGVGFFEFAGLE